MAQIQKNYFSYESFAKHIAKWVRSNHVTTDPDWLHQEVIVNGLASDIAVSKSDPENM